MTKLGNENTKAHQFLNDRLIVFRRILSVASFFFASLHIHEDCQVFVSIFFVDLSHSFLVAFLPFDCFCCVNNETKLF